MSNKQFENKFVFFQLECIFYCLNNKYCTTLVANPSTSEAQQWSCDLYKGLGPGPLVQGQEKWSTQVLHVVIQQYIYLGVETPYKEL